MYWTKWNTEITVSTGWFINYSQYIFQNQGVYRTQRNTGSATKTPIVIDYEK